MAVNGTLRSEDRRNEVPDGEMGGSRSRSEVPNVKCAVMRIRRKGEARRARDACFLLSVIRPLLRLGVRNGVVGDGCSD